MSALYGMCQQPVPTLCRSPLPFETDHVKGRDSRYREREDIPAVLGSTSPVPASIVVEDDQSCSRRVLPPGRETSISEVDAALKFRDELQRSVQGVAPFSSIVQDDSRL